MQRGRKSSDSLSTSVVSIVPGERPPPPEDLTDEQAAIWQSTLARMPADWATPEIWPALKQLCRLESISAMLGRELAEIERGTLKDPEGFKRFGKVRDWHEKEGRAITSLMTKLRVSPQTRYDKFRANTAYKSAVKKNPWETD
jgi:hypothetical protein